MLSKLNNISRFANFSHFFFYHLGIWKNRLATVWDVIICAGDRLKDFHYPKELGLSFGIVQHIALEF